MRRFRSIIVAVSFVLSACSGASTSSNSLVPSASLPAAATQNAPRQDTHAAGQPLPRRTFSVFSVIHAFSGGTDGANPSAGLTIDGAGNLYGTTSLGGSDRDGGVFRLKPLGSGWVLSSLHTFTGGADGASPMSRVIFGPDGALYGTNLGTGPEGGVVYKLTVPANPCVAASCPWHLTVLHQFVPASDGGSPEGDVTFDSAGNLYGTADAGGPYNMGTVWEVTPSGTFSVLYTFGSSGMQDASGPWGGVDVGPDGNLYGTTTGGGAFGFGSVFKLTRSGSGWSESRIYDFQAGSQGEYPHSGIAFDASGNLYGSTESGGGSGGGTLFKLTPAQGGWTFSILQSLSGRDGPDHATLTADSSGDLFGTTLLDGANSAGNVFILTAQGTYTDLHDFTGNDGSGPTSTITVTPNHIYGTTSAGGSSGQGVVFEITSSAQRSRRPLQSK